MIYTVLSEKRQNGQTEVDIHSFSLLTIQDRECADRCRIVVWRQQRCTVALPGSIKDSAVTTRLVLYAGSRARPSHKPRNGGNFTSEATVTYSLRVRAGGCTVNVRNAWLTGRQRDEKTASQSMRRSYQRPPRISAGARVLLMSGQ